LGLDQAVASLFGPSPPINQSGSSTHRRRQQFVQISVKLRQQLWVHAEQAEMSADALQRTELVYTQCVEEADDACVCLHDGFLT